MKTKKPPKGKWRLKSEKVPKPFVLSLLFVQSFRTLHFFGLLGKNPNENETAPAIPGRLAALTASRFVCVSVYSSLNHYENRKK